MLKGISLPFLFVCVTFLTITPGSLGVQWHVEFYENVNCTGQSENLTITEDGLDTQWVTNASSVKVIGLWKLTLKKSMEQGYLRGKTIQFNNAQPGQEKCINKNELVGEPDFQDFRFYYAEVIMGIGASLIVSTEGSFKGLRYHAVSFTLNGTLIPRPTKMESMVLSEMAPWLVYPQTNFQGDPTCIHPKHSNFDGYTVFKPGKDIEIEIVGSVRRADFQECTTRTTTPAGASCNIISLVLIYLCICLSFIFKSS